MTNQTLVRTALGVLRRPGVWKIGFDLSKMTVTGQRFAMVAKAIEDGKIECKAVGQFPTNPAEKLPPRTVVAAKYIPADNTMYFSRDNYGATAYEQSVIFHEATHAIFDLFKDDNLPEVRTLAINDESAAVLAQAHFFRLCTNNDSAGIHMFSMMYDGPGDTALKLVDKMMAETGDFERIKTTYFLRPDQTQRLRDAVALDWGFTKTTDPDGGVRDSTGIQYIYDGVVPCYSCWVHGN